MSQPIDLCLADFIRRFLTDISDVDKAGNIECKIIFDVVPVYKENIPTNSLNSIADDFKNCIESKVGSAAIITAEQFGIIIVAFVILTAVFMILVVVILGLLDKKQQKGIIIGLIIFFALIYIIVGWLLIHNSFLTISNEITNIEQITDNCVNQAINDTELFLANQAAAIDKTLCAYPLECTL